MRKFPYRIAHVRELCKSNTALETIPNERQTERLLEVASTSCSPEWSHRGRCMQPCQDLLLESTFDSRNFLPLPQVYRKGSALASGKIPRARSANAFQACAGSLADLFYHAGSFPFRRQSRLQRCGEMLSPQAHVSTQSAIGKRGSHQPGFLARACDGVSEEECFTELVPLQ